MVRILVGVAFVVVALGLTRLLAKRRRLHWKLSEAPTFDGALHFRCQGDGPSTVLLLHGLAASNRYFGAAFDALADGRMVLAVDLLGFGNSPRPADSSYSVAEHVGALRAVLESRAATGPLWIVGHSTGSVLAVELAHLLRDRVVGVVAFGPALYDSPETARQRLGDMGRVVRLFALENSLSRALCLWMCAHRQWAARLAPLMRPDLPAVIASDGVRHSWPAYSGTLAEVVINGAGATRALELSVPVHLVIGKNDRVVDREALAQLASKRPNVILHSWNGGHELPLTHPKECVSLLQECLARGGGLISDQ